MRRLLAVAALLIGTQALSAQAPAIIAGEGWEAFPAVEYQGGDARYPRKMMGALVLTDSTIALHACHSSHCATRSREGMWFSDSIIFSIPLLAVREVSASTQTRSPGVGRRIMWGALANDRNEEYFALAFDSETSAEAPVFKVRPTQGGALDAKVRFRLRRLGVELPQ